MRIAINVILVIAIFGLGYLLIASIREPIAFKKAKQKRESAVIEKLMTIRNLQEMYRNVYDEYANHFDTLNEGLREGNFTIISVYGDPDDPNNETIYYDTTYRPVIDTIVALEINLDSLKYVPYGEGAVFDIQADTITYQKTLTYVVEVGVQRSAFMGPWGDPRFSKYDSGYNPKKRIKFGDMNSPNTSGNWE